MKYKLKQKNIEAFQLTEEIAIGYFIDKKLLPFGVELSGSFNSTRRRVYEARFFLRPERVSAFLGDWIIETNGVLSVLGPDAFIKAYEPDY